MKILFSIVLFCFSCLALAGDDDTTFELRYWDENNPYRMEMVTSSSLRLFYGNYSEPMAFTGGTNIYLFPDGQFVISEECDICPPEAVGYGRYEFADSSLNLEYEKRDGNLPSRLYLRLGMNSAQNQFSGIKTLFTEQQLAAIKKDPDTFDFYIQSNRDLDWKAIKERFIASE